MYKEISAFVNFLLYDSAFKRFTDAIFCTLAAYIHKKHIYFLSLRFTLGFFSSNVIKRSMCNIKKLV